VEQQDFLFESKKVVGDTTETIAMLAGLDSSADEEAISELSIAVEEAYYKTFRSIRIQAEENSMSENVTETDLILADAFSDLQKQFDEMKNIAESDAFDVFSTDNYNKQEIKNLLADSLNLDLGIPYLLREMDSNLLNDNRVLLEGKIGSGKSRMLIEIALQKIESMDIDEIIIPKHSYINTIDAVDLSAIPFSENTILIWDNLHEVYHLNQENNLFPKSINSIETAMSATDSTEGSLEVICSLRTSATNEIGDYNKPGAIWDEFTNIEIPELDEDEIWTFIELFSDHYELDIDESIRLALAEKTLRADPSPFYIESVFLAASGRENIELADVTSYPDNITGLWEQNYQAFMKQEEHKKKLLWSMKILRELRISYYMSLVEGIYTRIFNREKGEFYEEIGQLESEGWLNRDTSKLYGTGLLIAHDVQIDAVATDIEQRLTDVYEQDISDFLLGFASEYVPDFPQWIESALQQNFAVLQLSSDIQQDQNRIEQHFLRAISTTDDLSEPYHNYANFLSQSERDEEAEKYNSKAVNTNPDSFPLRWAYADRLARNGKLEKSSEQYKVAEQFNPNDARFYRAFGVVLVDLFDHEEAKDKFETAIELGSKNNVVLGGHIYTAWRLNEPPEDKYIQRFGDFSDDLELNLLMAAVLFEQRQMTDAEMYFNRAKEIDPDHPFIDQFRGLRSVCENDIDEALSYFDKSDYKDGEISMKEYLRHATSLVNGSVNEERDEAIEYFYELFENGFRDPDIYRRYCETLIQLNNNTEDNSWYQNEAKRRYRELLNFDGGEWVDRFHYAQLLYHSNHDNENIERLVWVAIKQLVDTDDLDKLEEVFYFLLIVSSNRDDEGSPEYWYEEALSYHDQVNNSVVQDYIRIIKSVFSKFTGRN
jgi:Tfp pilus assembly protein PilF